MKTALSWGMFVLAVLLWGAFGYFAWHIGSARAAYAAAALETREEAARQENATRLRATIEGTELERAALEHIVKIPVLEIVQAIETAGKQAGALNVSIGEAASAPSTPIKIGTISVVARADGSFVALLRTVLLLETLTIPTTIEQFEITKTDKEWHLTARLRTVGEAQ